MFRQIFFVRVCIQIMSEFEDDFLKCNLYFSNSNWNTVDNEIRIPSHSNKVWVIIQKQWHSFLLSHGQFFKEGILSGLINVQWWCIVTWGKKKHHSPVHFAWCRQKDNNFMETMGSYFRLSFDYVVKKHFPIQSKRRTDE